MDLEEIFNTNPKIFKESDLPLVGLLGVARVENPHHITELERLLRDRDFLYMPCEYPASDPTYHVFRFEGNYYLVCTELSLTKQDVIRLIEDIKLYLKMLYV